MGNIINDLFPQYPERKRTRVHTPSDTIPTFTVEELQSAAKSLKNGKAPGPDGVPTAVIKVITQELPYMLLNVYNACIKNGTFCTCWKKQRLVLLDKGKGPPITSSSFRPLCMLDVAGKLFEKLIKMRLSTSIENSGGLAQNQHGFRKGHSTIGAIEEALRIVKNEWSKDVRSRVACILITLDVKNAFNSVG